MKIETKWNIGKAGVGFGVTARAEVSDTDAEVLKQLGFKYLLQRVTSVDDVLGGYTKGADGKRTRVAGFKRGNVPFGEATAKALAEVLSEVHFPDSTKEKPHTLKAEVQVALAEGESAGPAYAREKKKFAEKESTEAGLAAWLESFCGYTGESHGADGEYAVEALAAAKRAIDEFLAKNI